MRLPSYRKHSSGQARVSLNGRDYLLGTYGTKESKQKYNRLCGGMACVRSIKVVRDASRRTTDCRTTGSLRTRQQRHSLGAKKRKDSETLVSKLAGISREIPCVLTRLYCKSKV